jgi:hypothetical protein
MSEATLLESRVDKIERDNRRLKLTVGASTGVVTRQNTPSAFNSSTSCTKNLQ